MVHAHGALMLVDNNIVSLVLGIFRNGEQEAPRSSVKALNFCAYKSGGELQDFALNKLKGIEDEIIIKLKSAIKEVVDGDAEFSLLVNLKKLDDLQLSRQISIESLHKDLGETDSQKLLKTVVVVQENNLCILTTRSLAVGYSPDDTALEIIVKHDLQRDGLSVTVSSLFSERSGS
ncbi:hypothetical protein KY290_026930 [Solanum tuberosum]|uniref:Cohesin subunit SCC3/SA HEAT-repeats domain-containing protein n=1 Tax=Solanum tuberosum TaxID=4113 RepID=A0ABQ7UXV0_SOLTU|nr:hypothetical protein KY284_023757 [Solanum tuberosum]KAH0756660.1 hypothetical protein KY290_026930 [Solanum tuberosum]